MKNFIIIALSIGVTLFALDLMFEALNSQNTILNILAVPVFILVVFGMFKMYKLSSKFLAISIIMLTMSSCGYNRIDAGHAGIKVNLYGNEKGVDDIAEVTGAVWYNPFTTEVYEVPTFVQNAVYTVDDSEGSESNEEFRITTKDGMVVRFDVSINYLTPYENVTQIFRKFRKPPKVLEKTIIRNYLRKAFNETANQYDAAELYEKRNEFTEQSTKHIKRLLEPEGFVVEQVVLLNELRLPESVTENIDAKINATQTAMRKNEEIAQSKADSAKRVIDAGAYAREVEIKAKAEAEANKIVANSLTTNLIRYKQIERWDGVLSKVSGQNGGLLIQVD